MSHPQAMKSHCLARSRGRDSAWAGRGLRRQHHLPHGHLSWATLHVRPDSPTRAGLVPERARSGRRMREPRPAPRCEMNQCLTCLHFRMDFRWQAGWCGLPRWASWLGKRRAGRPQAPCSRWPTGARSLWCRVPLLLGRPALWWRPTEGEPQGARRFERGWKLVPQGAQPRQLPRPGVGWAIRWLAPRPGAGLHYGAG